MGIDGITRGMEVWRGRKSGCKIFVVECGKERDGRETRKRG